ncbi:MAG: hypothetical protein ACYCYP_14200 [Leptospirales bacterium]
MFNFLGQLPGLEKLKRMAYPDGRPRAPFFSMGLLLKPKTRDWRSAFRDSARGTEEEHAA